MTERNHPGEPLMWVAEPPPQDVRAALARLCRSDDVVAVAVMPDVHLANDVCVGTVTATSHLLYPEAVGGDIGCGMAAVQLAVEPGHLRQRDIAAKVLHALSDAIPVIKHPYRKELPQDLQISPLSSANLERQKQRDAAVQLGTVGRGNHFVELQEDEEGNSWLMVHSGSRGIGPLVRDHHLCAARRSRSGLHFVDAEAADGQAYLNDLSWAVRYADANRQEIIRACGVVLADLLGGHPLIETMIICHHNHVVRERIGTSDLWLHRKGAISAKAEELGIIPGSMGSASYHVKGKGCAAALLSSSHGAGRALSRADARRGISVASLAEQMAGVWFDHRYARKLVEEAPAAYKDVAKVMRAQRELTRSVRRLTPILSYKGA